MAGGLSMKYNKRGQSRDQRRLEGINSLTRKVDEWLSSMECGVFLSCGCEYAFLDGRVGIISSNHSLWDMDIYIGGNDKDGQFIIWRARSCIDGCDKKCDHCDSVSSKFQPYRQCFSYEDASTASFSWSWVKMCSNKERCKEKNTREINKVDQLLFAKRLGIGLGGTQLNYSSNCWRGFQRDSNFSIWW